MKKFLSLVLALVMTMSLVTVSAGAKEFKDDADITYDEAVAVISEIGVVDGYTDGDFRPTAGLSRGAAAKIICNLILGPTTAAELRADTAPFKDVPVNHDFAGYIAYCAKEGIISGYGDGAFRPTAPLTGYAFMKMLLGALGYDSAREGYTGANWSINVAKRALNAGLNKSLVGDFDGAKNVNREEAALYAFNTLKADMVEYGGKVLVGDVAVVSGDCKAMTYQNSATRKTNIKDDDYVQFAEQYFPKLVLTEDHDAFGRPDREWEFKGNEIGTYVNYDLLKEEYTTKVTGKDLYDLLGKSAIEDYETTVYIDGVDDVKVNGNVFNETAMNKNNKAGVGATGDGVLTQVFLDSDQKEITVAIINTYLAIATGDYNAKKDAVTFEVYKVDDSKGELVKKAASTENLTVSGEDFDVEDVAEDDAYLVNVADNEIKILAKAEVVADTEISSFKIGSNVTTNGTKYGFANTAMYDATVLDYYTGVSSTINLKDTTYNIYLDQYGYLIGIDEVEAAKNYVFITGVDSNASNLSNKTADAAGIFLDGTMKVVSVDMSKSPTLVSAIAPGVAGRALVNTWCTYTVNKDGVYTVKVVPSVMGTAKVAQQASKDVSDTTNYDIDKKHVTLPGNASDNFSKVYGNDNSVYLTATLKKITTPGGDTAGIIDDVDNVTTGVKNANLTTWTAAQAAAETGATYNACGAYTLYKSNGYIIAAVVVGEDDAASKNLVYTHKGTVELESYDKEADEWTWTRKVIANGEEVEIKEVSDSLTYLNNMTQYQWYQVKYNAAGEVIGVLDEDAVSTGADAANDIYPKWNLTAANKDNNADAGEYVTEIIDVEPSINTYDTVLYMEAFTNDTPSLKGSTLFVSNTDKEGFFVAEDVKAVLIQTNDLKQTTTYETGVKALEDMIDDLNAVKNSNPEVYNYTISAILDDGAATTVIIYDRVDATGDAGTNVSSDIQITDVTLTVDASNKVTAALAGSGTIKATDTVSAKLMKSNKAEGDALVSTSPDYNITANVPVWTGIEPGTVNANGNYYVIVTVTDANNNVIATATSAIYYFTV